MNAPFGTTTFVPETRADADDIGNEAHASAETMQDSLLVALASLPFQSPTQPNFSTFGNAASFATYCQRLPALSVKLALGDEIEVTVYEKPEPAPPRLVFGVVRTSPTL